MLGRFWKQKATLHVHGRKWLPIPRRKESDGEQTNLQGRPAAPVEETDKVHPIPTLKRWSRLQNGQTAEQPLQVQPMQTLPLSQLCLRIPIPLRPMPPHTKPSHKGQPVREQC